MSALHSCTVLFFFPPVTASEGYFLVPIHQLNYGGFSCCWAHAVECWGLSICGIWYQTLTLQALEHRFHNCGEWAYFAPGNVGSSQVKQELLSHWQVESFATEPAGKTYLTFDYSFPLHSQNKCHSQGNQCFSSYEKMQESGLIKFSPKIMHFLPAVSEFQITKWLILMSTQNSFQGVLKQFQWLWPNLYRGTWKVPMFRWHRHFRVIYLTIIWKIFITI